jgi:NodT family efflux transporter outer membrane factor (OMF) lipoprotein
MTVFRCKSLLSAICSIALLASVGCKVGPDYRGTPLRSVTQRFVNSGSTGVWSPPNMTAIPPAYRFVDPVLASLIDTALVDSPSVRELQFRVCESRALVELASGQGLPFADAGGTYERRKRSSNSQPFVGPNGDAFDFFSLGAVSRWELDIVGRIARETEAATADYQASVEDVQDIRRLLVGEIARTYVQVRLYQELQQQNEINLKIQYAALDKVKARIEAGKVGRLDLVQLQSRLRLTESDRPLFDEQLKLALTNLSVLIGQSPSSSLIAMIGRSAQLSPAAIGHGVPADLIRHRPDMRRAEREVAAASARIGVAQAELYPKLSLLGTISVDSRNVSSLISSDALAYTVGPSFSWNILSLGRIERAIEIQRAQYKQAIERYQQTMLTSVADVENSLVSFQESQRRIDILQKAVAEAGEAVELAGDQYDADRASLERVVSNQRRLLRASIELANARAAMATASVNLVQAVGVDWSYQPVNNYEIRNVVPQTVAPAALPEVSSAPESDTSSNNNGKANAREVQQDASEAAKPRPKRTPSVVAADVDSEDAKPKQLPTPSVKRDLLQEPTSPKMDIKPELIPVPKGEPDGKESLDVSAIFDEMDLTSLPTTEAKSSGDIFVSDNTWSPTPLKSAEESINDAWQKFDPQDLDLLTP